MPETHHRPASTSAARKALLLGLILLPVAVTVIILLRGLWGREFTPKWKAAPSPPALVVPSTNAPPTNAP